MARANRRISPKAGRLSVRGRSSYAKVGVDTTKEESGLGLLVEQLRKSFAARPAGAPGHVRLDFGYYANVIEVGDIGLAISTDGVGTKVLIAQMMDRYATIGIDCVAMNVNDILCVGAEPLAMVDYLAVQTLRPKLVAEVAKGLAEGAKRANITIPGGEIAQIRDVIKNVPGKPGCGFDLAGTAVGTVELDRIVDGARVEADDIVLGLRSTGVHSNGLTLARRVFRKYPPHTYVRELGQKVGDELLTPTRIYVREVLAVLKAGVDVRALAHITSDGFRNLRRVKNEEIGYVIHSLPEPHPIFHVIQRETKVDLAEMYEVYNMGIGFCLVVSGHGDHAGRAMEILKRHDSECYDIGRVVASPTRTVVIEPAGLIGDGKPFRALTKRDARLPKG